MAVAMEGLGKKKSVLMTPDPYHTPGYGGFCPQFKYQIGETFGRTTSRLLTDKSVASSGRLVLTNIDPKKNPYDQERAARMDMIQDRTHSWGDQKLIPRILPGYTGFIPKGQHYFGSRYAENCVKAISEFENDHQAHNCKTAEMSAVQALQSGRIQKKEGDQLPQISTKHVTPLRAVTKDAKPYIPKTPPHFVMMSPYFMANENDAKCFVSGYTGFVPRSRGMLGSGYPFITHMALNEFTDGIRNYKDIQSKPIQIQRKEVAKVHTNPIYPADTGLVPHYTGHIPGERFRLGNTFGHSTKDAYSHYRHKAATRLVVTETV